MRDAVVSLNDLAMSFEQANAIPEIDWSRLRGLEFQEALRERLALAKKLDDSQCVLCPNFNEHVSVSLPMSRSEL